MRLKKRKDSGPSAGGERSGSGDFGIPAGEIVTVRAYAGSRAEEEPRAVVVAGRELPVEEVEWRAVQERDGERRRAFVVRLGGTRVRLAYVESASMWEIERVLGPAPERGREQG